MIWLFLQCFILCCFCISPNTVSSQSDPVDSLQKVLQRKLADTTRIRTMLELGEELERIDFARARSITLQAIRMAERIKSRRLQSSGYNLLGWVYKKNEDFDSALFFANKNLSLSKQLKNKDMESSALTLLGSISHGKKDFKKAIRYYHEAIEANKAIKDENGIAVCYNNLGNIYDDQSKYREAIHWHTKSLNIKKKLKDKSGMAGSYMNIGVVYVRTGEYDTAMVMMIKSAHLYESLGDKISLAQTYANIAVICNMNNNLRKSLVYALKSAKILESTSSQGLLALVYGNIGVNYEHLKKLDSALIYHEKSYAISEKRNDLRTMSSALNNIGIIHQLKKNFPKAIENFNRTLSIKKEIEDINGLSLTYYNLGSVYVDLRNPTKAIENFLLSKELAEQTETAPNLKNAYKGLADAYALKGDYKSAYVNHVEYLKLKDSLMNTERIEKIEELETKYETEKKEKQNRELTIKNQKAEIALAREAKNTAQQAELASNRMKWLIGIVLASIIIILIVWFLLYRRQQQQRAGYDAEIIKQREEGIKAIITATEEERKRIAKDLHDGIGQQMGGLKMAWQNLSGKINERAPEEFGKLQELTKILDDTAQEVRSISHQMMPRVLTEIGLIPAMEDMLKKTLGNTSIEYTFENFGVDQRLDERIEISLYRISQELINNIIKHAGATKTSVQVIQNPKFIVLIVEDNGSGFNAASSSNGIGLMNIQSRVNTIHGEINYEPSTGSGTVATVRIPLN